MKVTDIPYNEYQRLLEKANAFDAGILDTSKFVRVDYGFYIALKEQGLIEQFKIISELKEYYLSAIHGYCSQNKMGFSDFVDKYGVKK